MYLIKYLHTYLLEWTKNIEYEASKNLEIDK